MLLELSVRHLLLATWEVDPEQVARNLPAGLEPALAGDRALVSLAALRNAGGRLGRLPVPPFSQLNVRTYVAHGDDRGVFFLQLRAGLAGMGGALFGAPVRPARITVHEGSATAPGLGVSFRYRRAGRPDQLPSLDPPLGAHEVGYFEAAGLRRLVAVHRPCDWERAELVAPPRFDPLPALGFDVGQPRFTLYAERTDFRAELPPSKVLRPPGP